MTLFCKSSPKMYALSASAIILSSGTVKKQRMLVWLS